MHKVLLGIFACLIFFAYNLSITFALDLTCSFEFCSGCHGGCYLSVCYEAETKLNMKIHLIYTRMPLLRPEDLRGHLKGFLHNLYLIRKPHFLFKDLYRFHLKLEFQSKRFPPK
ncbi:hypothetical protein ACH5RR_021692 [Cinchona calisaya]|uniref:Uncharacterized protein n=1 Tax=Cinchona calisaya TaxID=153742 RepID=A0ABD2ZIB3_9GENT